MSWVTTAVLLVAVSVPLPAQQLVWERIGVKESYRLGRWMAAIGDINGDGYEDLVNAVDVRPGRCGTQLWFFSGKDGKTLRVRSWYAGDRPYERLAAAGDANRDGVADYAVTVGDCSMLNRDKIVEIRSGKDDRLIWQVSGPWNDAFGYAILGDLDLDGDRKPDLVVSAEREKDAGAVHAYANGGKLLYKLVGKYPGKYYFGFSLGKVGDVDKDGKDDFVLGANEPTRRGMAVLVSGATGRTLVTGYGERPYDHLGFKVAGAGDIDGDGVPDFVAGSSGGFMTRARVRAFSGKTGKVIFQWTDTTGFALPGRGIDMDRDGVPDIVVGTPGEVTVRSGRDGSTILRVSNRTTGIGYFVAALRPQPGSPFGLFAAGEPAYGPGNIRPTYLGRIRVYRASPPGVQVYGATCKGTLETSPRIGIRDLQGKGARIHLSDAAPGSPALLLLGLSRTKWGTIPLPLALDPLGFSGCKLQTS
ncbi:MAG: FG-GAP repeat domain-containing protein, partial [Planctomycetota bacterium]